MKKQTGIWIDTAKAIVVTLSSGEEIITEIESDIENRIYHQHEGDQGTFSGSRHIGNEKKFDERKINQTDHFLKNVLEQIKNSDEIYVFGPAEMKLKLKSKFEGNQILSAKLKSVEPADGMTLNQVVSHVKKFYSH